ncbi:hypothetical protein AXG89_41680 (plasmid) [Burkholderia sp. PAMC 26561]|nr:hypothetical protein AXG89_41680 [Burkholderia sp. PAMC 26561]
MEIFRQNKLAIGVLLACTFGVFYLFILLPSAVTRDLKESPSVTEHGMIISIVQGRGTPTNIRITVQIGLDSINIPSTLDVKVGDVVEVTHLRDYPSRVIKVWVETTE